MIDKYMTAHIDDSIRLTLKNLAQSVEKKTRVGLQKPSMFTEENVVDEIRKDAEIVNGSLNCHRPWLCLFSSHTTINNTWLHMLENKLHEVSADVSTTVHRKRCWKSFQAARARQRQKAHDID